MIALPLLPVSNKPMYPETHPAHPRRSPVEPGDNMEREEQDLLAEGLMTVKQVCEYLQYSESAVWKLMADGHLCFTKVGGARRIPRVAVKRLVASRMKR